MSENGSPTTDQMSLVNPVSPLAVASIVGVMTTSKNLSVAGNGDLGAGMVKRKRGRPRKYETDASKVNLVSPGALASASNPPSKRGRGRPKGSKKSKQLGSAGGILGTTTGRSFTPYVETVHPGEDVFGKISSFSQGRPQAISILSAAGTVSSVTLCQASSSGGIMRYEGIFQILSLSGSYTFGETAGSRRKLWMLSISLAKPDGWVFGGAVAGPLIAAGPIQLMFATFKQNSKASLQAGMLGDRGMGRASAPVRMTEGNCPTPMSVFFEPNNRGVGGAEIITSNQNTNPSPLSSACWNESQPMLDQRTSHEI